MPHSFVTVALPFDGARSADVIAYLNTLGNPANPEIAGRLDDEAFVHFMSINVVPGEAGERAHLIIEASCDGGPDAALERIAKVLADELRALVAKAGIETGRMTLSKRLARHRIKVGNGWFSIPGLEFDGTPQLSVVRIRREAELAGWIREIVDRAPSATALDVLERVRVELWNNRAAKWAFVAEPAPFLEGVPPSEPLNLASVFSAIARFLWPHFLAAAIAGALIWSLASFGWAVGATALAFAAALFLRGAPSPRDVTMSVVWSAVSTFLWPLLLAVAVTVGITWLFAGWGWAIAAGLLTLIALLVFLAWGYARFRRKEETDVPADLAPSAMLVEEMMKRESFYAQNLLAAASTVKSGFIRHVTLRLGLWAAGLAAHYYSRPGYLTDIGVIHFARWFRLRDTDTLMFFSNYDGALESYLEDFIERGYRGVTAIWSNTVGFPKTKNLLDGGAKDGDRLRRWTRRQMFPALFWYTAYPDLTLSRIRTNAAIRQGLATAKSEAEAADWLTCFGSAPRPPVEIEETEVPTLVFGGLSHLTCGAALFLRLSGDTGKAKAWLKELEPDVAFGLRRNAKEALVIGFAESGLSKLGLKNSQLDTFPVPFQQGNHAPWRARAVGDTGDNAPESWYWGAPRASVDAVAVIYANDAQQLKDRLAARSKEIGLLGHEIVQTIRFKQLPPEKKKDMPREPFGFADGISQPIIRGTPRAAEVGDHHQVVAPGEFILGYPDNLGYFPPTPTVPAHEDPDNILPAVVRESGQRPNFAEPLPSGKHDLGRNGTFLVVRQLEQNVKGFANFLRVAATELPRDARTSSLDPAQIEDWIGAKLVGRWKDGSSLVRHPHVPGAKPGLVELDNDFLYGEEDASGMRCPFGAHIRRANPRDSFEPGSKEQLSITNRHRIFRVGRSYEPQNGWENPGLVFMCLNVDIERQFEFVQQTWLLAPSFHGLENETDAVLGNRGGKNVFTIPTPRGPLRVTGLRDFVAVRGGGYFFLPSRRALRFLAR
jgi:deferrochelatase/peroxidase EfeB